MMKLTQKFVLGLGVAALVGMGSIDARAQEGTWTRSQVQLMQARKLEGVTTIGGQISVISGRNGGTSLPSVERLMISGGRVTAVRAQPNLPGEIRDGGESAQCGSGRVLESGGDENSNRARRANETLLESLDGNPRVISFLNNPIQRAFHVVANVGDNVFVISGDAGNQGVSRSVQSFNCGSLNLNADGANRGDLAGDNWMQRAQIPTAVAFAGGSSVGNLIVVTGGRAQVGNGPALNVVQIFDPQANAWKMGAPMPTARFGHALLRLNDNEVVAVGGTDGQRVLDTVEIFNVQNNQWRMGTRLPNPVVFARGDNSGQNQAVLIGGSRGAGPNDASLNEILEFSLSGGSPAQVAPAPVDPAPVAPTAPMSPGLGLN